jgi:acyl dehydratase
MTTLTEVGHNTRVTLVEDLKRTQIVQYAGASGDYNPLHTDERYAVAVGGFPGVFAHGMLTAGMTARAVQQLFSGDFVARFGGRFMAQVWPGDTLVAEIEVTEVDAEESRTRREVAVTTRNQEGTVVYTATATVIADDPGSRPGGAPDLARSRLAGPVRPS